MHAAIGLELPCTAALPPDRMAWVMHSGHLLTQCPPRCGRLLQARAMGRALRQLLGQCEQRVRESLLALPRGQADAAQRLVAAYRAWEQRTRKAVLTGHQLRLHGTERFCCWALPTCVAQQLQRQWTLPGTPSLVQLVMVVPVTGHMRLLDKVSAYTHAPARYLTGPWLQAPDDRVQYQLCGHCIVVVVD